MEVINKELIPVFLTNEEALLFIQFQKKYQVIAYILGCLDSLNVNDVKNSMVSFNFDQSGVLGNTTITKHYKRLQ